MPTKPRTPCREAGCPKLVTTPGFCKEHAKSYIRKARASYEWEDYGSEWRKIRASFLKLYPWCSEAGCNRSAVDVDHIKPLRYGGTHTFSNLQGFCRSHHSAKSMREINERKRAKGVRA